MCQQVNIGEQFAASKGEEDMKKWGHQIHELKGNIPGVGLYETVTNFLAA